MKRLALILALACVGCDGTSTPLKRPYTVQPEYPTVNLPKSLRQQNWLGSANEGSCVYATMVMALRWQGRHDLAAKMKGYGNGSWSERLTADFTREGIRFAETETGDVKFLEWACRTRRGCGITWGYNGRASGHMLLLVHLDDKYAAILDNNFPTKITWYKREALLNFWKSGSGWAVTPSVGPPAAPLP